MRKSKINGISQKLTRSIISIVLISSLVIGLAGVVSTLVINNISQQIYNKDLNPLSTLYKISYDFSCVRVDLRDLILNSGNPKTAEALINKSFDDMNKQLRIYKNELISSDEKSNYAAMEKDVSSFTDLKNNIIKSVNSDNAGIAQQMLGENTTEELNSTITNAFTINSKRAQQRNAASIIVLFIVLFAIITVIFASILLSARTGKRIAKSISTPINKLVAAANSISIGNLDVSIDIDSDDETGILAEAFQKIIDSLRRLDTDVESLISEALIGNLDQRVDISCHDGAYRKIIDGVNRMLDTVKAPLDVASVYINNLAEGVKQPNIENHYEGYYTILVDNLNKVNNAVNILAEETGKLAEAGLDGNLDVRGNETKLKGTYAEIIIGINKTFDAIKSPLDSASVFIGKLAEGNTSEPLYNKYKGYYATLIDHLNDVRSSLLILLDESQKLVNAGKNGELDVRGNTDRVSGSYADIIGGMNEIFETITKPLSESSFVLEKMAVNDYTVSMSDGYKGMLKIFAQSISSVRGCLLDIERIFAEISQGSIDSLDKLKEVGARSENDRMLPSMILTMETIKNLIEETGNQASAAINGNLGFRGDECKFQGGYRKVIEGINRTMEAVTAPIEESSQVLQQLAQGDLTVEVTGEYNGEYNRIKTSLNDTISAFAKLLGSINVSAAQVAEGSNQVANASQSLSQGATEQASSVDELTSSITEMATHIKQSAASAVQASSLSEDAQEKAIQGNEKMSEMLGSMAEINESSTNISKIIKTIDNIAFQTNILALNAAVEAARAGQYGKGFSVVAQEVRNLAGQSAKAAEETATLIKNSISKVESGTKIANETAGMLVKIAESVQTAADLVLNIEAVLNEQAGAIMQIDQGVSQVSSVVQTNSATAEESASLSEELSGQASVLMKLVSKFKLM